MALFMSIMRRHSFDAIVVGAGLLGASAAYALAKEGKSVAVVDAREAHNKEGSSHGFARITRPYGGNEEHPVYDALTARSQELIVNELESHAGEIFKEYPAIVVVRKASQAQAVMIESVTKARVPTCIHSPETLSGKFGYHIPETHVAVETIYGTINPYVILDKLYAGIWQRGGEILFEAPVETWTSNSRGAEVVTKEDTLSAHKIIIAPGKFIGEFLTRAAGERPVDPRLVNAFKVYAVPVVFFQWPREIKPSILRMPLDDGRGNLYALPEPSEDGTLKLKIGFHQVEETRPHHVTASDILEATEWISNLCGGKPPSYESSLICYYTMPDPKPKHRDVPIPVVDALPGFSNAYLLAGGAGNAAKLALALGEAAAARAFERRPKFNMTDFSALPYIGAGPQRPEQVAAAGPSHKPKYYPVI